MVTSDLPVGGTTGLCHEASAAIEEAARWLVAQGDTTGRAIIPELKQRFGISAVEACAACRQAGDIRRRAA